MCVYTYIAYAQQKTVHDHVCILIVCIMSISRTHSAAAPTSKLCHVKYNDAT
jgi:hypothetical protein